jgi:hypothetical protein
MLTATFWVPKGSQKLGFIYLFFLAQSNLNLTGTVFSYFTDE